MDKRKKKKGIIRRAIDAVIGEEEAKEAVVPEEEAKEAVVPEVSVSRLEVVRDGKPDLYPRIDIHVKIGSFGDPRRPKMDEFFGESPFHAPFTHAAGLTVPHARAICEGLLAQFPDIVERHRPSVDALASLLRESSAFQFFEGLDDSGPVSVKVWLGKKAMRSVVADIAMKVGGYTREEVERAGRIADAEFAFRVAGDGEAPEDKR